MWPTPRRGSRFSLSISSRTVCVPSPITCAGTRSRTATTFPFTTSTRWSRPFDELLDDHRIGVLLCDGPGGAHGLLVVEARRDAAAVARVERLEDDRKPDLERDLHGLIGVAHRRRRRGTGRPMSCSTRFVSSLSCAISTAMALVWSVIVAWMRRRLRPKPSCTSERELSRRTGMPRRRASSTIAPVDGPSRTVLAQLLQLGDQGVDGDGLAGRCRRGRSRPPRAWPARPTSSSS